MNKDMINIDDFVRDKLNAPSEKDDASLAWLKMKDLLDKEMPEKAAPFIFRWGKPAFFVGAAILAASLCIGGYQLNSIRNRNQNNNHQVNNVELSSENKYLATNTQDLTNSPKSALQNGSNDITNDEKLTKNEDLTNSNNHSVSSKPNQEDKFVHSNNNEVYKTSNTDIATTKPAHSNTKNSVAENLPSNSSQKPTKQLESRKTKNNVLDSKVSSVQNNALASSSVNGVKGVHQQNNNQTAVLVQSKKSESKLSNKLSANINSAENVNTAEKTQLVKKVDDNNNAPAPSLNDKQINNDSIPVTTVYNKEISNRGYPRKTTIIADSISIGKVAVTERSNQNLSVTTTPEKAISKEQAAVNSKAKKLSEKKAVNQFASKEQKVADLSTEKKNDAELSKTAKLEVKKRKKTFADWWNKMNMPEAIASAKNDIRNADFYLGFTGGVNYSIANANNFQGVQFGPTAEFVFNKHWSVFGSLKYFNRSGGTKTLHDNYSKEITTDTPYSKFGPNWNFLVHTDSTSRHFNFSTLHSFEMPLTVRYTLHKFYLMTGLNIAYYLGVNVEEVKKDHNGIALKTVQTNATKPILNEIKPTLSTSDFGSRIGIGYVFGLGYQISPAWQSDLVVTNTFWDNAKGVGANRLSKDFYKLPSVQLSVGYQFNRGKKRATFGPTSNQ